MIAARATAMTALLGALDDLRSSDLQNDLRDRLAVERALTQLVELASSINDHIVGTLTRETATSYRDSFFLAAEAGLIDDTLRDALLPSVGMRNVLVHEYVGIDVDRVAAAVPLALDVYAQYVAAITAFVDDLDL